LTLFIIPGNAGSLMQIQPLLSRDQISQLAKGIYYGQFSQSSARSHVLVLP
jgi:hypothetical protein